MPPAGPYDTMRGYLASENPEALADLGSKSAGLDKSAHNREAAQIHQLLRTEERIIQSPRQAEELLQPEVDIDIVVHMGCHAIRTPHIVDATMDILETLGYRTVPIGGFNNCCGILDAAQGDLETADAVDSTRFENAAAFDPTYMVTECTSCHATTETLSMGYRDPDFELTSMIELLNRRRDDIRKHVTETEPVTVTMHDHHGSYDWMPVEQLEYAREFFGSLPGVTVTEMEHSMENFLPCNFGKDPAEFGVDNLSETVWSEAEAAGADVLINFWHACDRELAWYEPQYPLATQNYTTFVAERLGFDYDNKTKQYKIWGAQGRLDAIIDDARPVFMANGLSEPEAREIAASVFVPQGPA